MSETDLKGQPSFILLNSVYMVDPATVLASNSVLRTLFLSENSLFIQWGKLGLYYYLIYIGVSKTTQCPFD